MYLQWTSLCSISSLPTIHLWIICIFQFASDNKHDMMHSIKHLYSSGSHVRHRLGPLSGTCSFPFPRRYTADDDAFVVDVVEYEKLSDVNISAICVAGRWTGAPIHIIVIIILKWNRYGVKRPHSTAKARRDGSTKRMRWIRKMEILIHLGNMRRQTGNWKTRNALLFGDVSKVFMFPICFVLVWFAHVNTHSSGAYKMIRYGGNSWKKWRNNM